MQTIIRLTPEIDERPMDHKAHSVIEFNFEQPEWSAT
jgi:hypothetical protein